jgi:branched-chain amino acid transport system permease protein
VTASKATTVQAGTPAASGYRSLSMPMRYLINAILVVVFLVVGELMIDGGVVSRYQTGVIEQVGIYIILAVSLNIATGYLGQLPLGHAGFMSVGGYSCAIFIMRMMDVVGVTARDFATGSPAAVGLFVIGIIFGGICAAICGLIIGVPALRLKGDYLAIITLGFAEIIRVVMQNIDGVLGFTLTGGAKGLTGIPSYTNFLNTFIVVAISLFLIHTMMKSRHGRAILSIRDNEIAAESCGVNTTYYKTLAFVASAFFAGVAGGLYAGCIGVMAPAKFGFMKSIEILVMVVLGGMGSMLGSVISATVLTILPEALRAVSDYRMVVYAVVLILVMIFRPEGLLGDYDFSMSRVIERIMNHGKRPEDCAPATTPAVEAVAAAPASAEAPVAPAATTKKDTGKEANTHE